MSGGGSNYVENPKNQYTPYTVDSAKLAEFMNSAAGQKFAGDLNPNATYFQNSQNKGIITGAPGSAGSKEVTDSMAAYQAWLAGSEQTQANWNAYSQAVAANQGGEGDNTITLGAAVSQRNRLLGSLANAGNPTAPTPGLGSMGMAGK